MAGLWRLPEVDENRVSALSRALGLRSLTARILVGRGVAEADHAHRFLQPRLAGMRGPDGIADLARALDRLSQALATQQTIGVFGDYDVDGVTSAAVLGAGLRALGGRVVPRCASRNAGYGFAQVFAEAFMRDGCSLVVTADCGTSDHATIGWLRQQGIDVIVIDHHQVPAGPSPALALINPHRSDDRFGFKGLASCGLAFYLMGALRTQLRRCGDARAAAWDPRELLDLVALGTVADVMPLTDENRALVAAGLKVLAGRQRPGLAALAEVAALPAGRPITATDIGFRLAPRLNAAGRLGDAQLSLDLLLAPDSETGQRLAQALDEQNRKRQEIQQGVLEGAFKQVESLMAACDGRVPEALVVGDEGWHPGVVGIVAAKLVDRYARPAIVVGFAGGKGRGSARTIAGFNLYQALSGVAGHLEVFGGHAAAAGLTVTADRFAAFRDDFVALARAWMKERPLGVGMEVDAFANLEDLDLAGADELARLAPFGCANPEPLLVLQKVKAAGCRVVGGNHLQLTLGHGASLAEAIGFGIGEQAPPPGSTVDVVACFEINEYRGSRRPRLRIKHLLHPQQGS